MREGGFVVMAMLLVAVVITVPQIPKANAVLPVIDGTCSPGNSVNVCGPFATVVGDALIVAVEINSASAAVISVSSVTDGGDTFLQQVSKTITAPADFSNPFPAKVEIWSAKHLSGSTVTVTIILTGATLSYDLEVISVSSVPPTAIAIATGSCIVDPGVCGTITTTTSNEFSVGNSIAVAALAGWGLSNAVAGTGFIPNPNPCSTMATCMEYSTSIASPTSYPMSCGSCGGSNFVAAALAGAIFAPATPAIILVVPCTAFQLQCWLYPMFFFGVYMIMIVGIARAADVPNKDMIGHLLEAFSLASLIGVVFGIMNIMFPLMITLIQVVRAARA